MLELGQQYTLLVFYIFGGLFALSFVVHLLRTMIFFD